MSDQSVYFQAVGDIALGDHPLCVGFGTHSRSRFEAPAFVFEHVLPILGRAELLFGNLECTLSERGLRGGDYASIQMRGHASYLDGLKAAGFDVLNHANNHSMQHGSETFLDTLELLRSAKIAPCGVAGATYRNALPLVVDRKGLRIGFLGYSLRPRQYFDQEPLYAEGHEKEILEDVVGIRRNCDVLIVSMHWGDEFVATPSPADVNIARKVIDAGANLIIGHHPHVLRGVEHYKAGHIVYSLGNFVCDMLWQDVLRESAILECRLSAGGVRDLRLIPVWIADDYRPVPLEGADAAALHNRIGMLNAALCKVPPLSEGAQQAYRVIADAALRRERQEAHWYFLRNIQHFPPRILWQQVRTWARNRLAERGIFQASATVRGA